MIDRRRFLAASLVGAATLIARRASAAVQPLVDVARPPLTVYKDAACGCCKKWVEHMQKSGWTVTAHDVPDVEVYKKKYGVPESLASCHTAIVTSGYVVEGHVPADVIDKLIAQHPADVVGLAVPGLVTGSPGREGANAQKYDVVSFNKAGKTKVFASR